MAVCKVSKASIPSKLHAILSQRLDTNVNVYKYAQYGRNIVAMCIHKVQNLDLLYTDGPLTIQSLELMKSNYTIW